MNLQIKAIGWGPFRSETIVGFIIPTDIALQRRVVDVAIMLDRSTEQLESQCVFDNGYLDDRFDILAAVLTTGETEISAKF